MITLADLEDISEISLFLDTFYRLDYFISKNTIIRMITGDVDPKFGKKRKPIFVWLDRDENGILGLAFVSLKGNLFQLLIRPDCRNKGIGKEFLKVINPKKIRCKIDVSSGDPRFFYFKCGYTQYQTTLSGDIAKTGKNQNIIILER